MAGIVFTSHKTRYVKFGETELVPVSDTAVNGGDSRELRPVGHRGPRFVELVCKQCSRTYQKNVRHLKKPGDGQFCSRSCHSADICRRRNANQSGAANPHWKGGVSRQPYRYTRRFRAKSPEKHAAQQAVYWAVRSGRLVRPAACSKCGTACKPHGHHDDYGKPLSVRWLCRACHLAHHRAITYRQSTSQRRAS